MTSQIADYALIGDCETAALVGRDGSIDWLCWPRFDSDACLAAILGDRSNGRWKIAARGEATISRRYRPGTLILETTFVTDTGRAVLIDFMPPRGSASDIVRIVRGLEGVVDMDMDLVLRFGYGALTPWVTRREDGALVAVAGPDMTVLHSDAAFHGHDMSTAAEFEVSSGQELAFVLTYCPSIAPLPKAIDPRHAEEHTEAFWREWTERCSVAGPYADAILRSLITLKALTYAPTGGIVAAPTASLPEAPGGVRNWDYRFCWIRDATLSLLALMNAGCYEEAAAWRDWLLRAAAGDPAQMQIMYGIGGERRLVEWEADWLAGHHGARPVRIGNAAHQQFQLDVYGELMDALAQARRGGLGHDDATWALQRAVIDHVATVWDQPDEGIWEVRGERRRFTHSGVMAWVALDRAVQALEQQQIDGPLEAWRALRDHIHAEVCEHGFNRDRGCFQRAFDDPTMDASLLLMAQVGFLAPDDPRFLATVEAIEQDLLRDGLVLRYDTLSGGDGLPPGEGAFLACSFWLADAYWVIGRHADARALFEHLLSLANDLGLLAEEYDPQTQSLVGNFPQAFSHVGLINTAFNLSRVEKPTDQRHEAGSQPPQDAGHGTVEG
ncbi:MAG: glycoside hydrolase family 15 protein [bacterium]|nr:glycoside hydrolase family 15 protein [bacterium]